MTSLFSEYKPDVVVDFLNPFACIAARAARLPLVTVIQADVHPDSRGFIWWKPAPADLPSSVPAVNKVLSEEGLLPIETAGDLFRADLTLIVDLPDGSPLPDSADVTYIGPILWQKQGESLPAWTDELSTDLPVIWLYPGNLQSARALCARPGHFLS